MSTGYEANLSDSTSFYSHGNHRTSVGFLKISEGVKVSKFAWILPLREVKFGDHPAANPVELKLYKVYTKGIKINSVSYKNQVI